MALAWRDIFDHRYLPANLPKTGATGPKGLQAVEYILTVSLNIFPQDLLLLLWIVVWRVRMCCSRRVRAVAIRACYDRVSMTNWVCGVNGFMI